MYSILSYDARHLLAFHRNGFVNSIKCKCILININFIITVMLLQILLLPPKPMCITGALSAALAGFTFG